MDRIAQCQCGSLRVTTSGDPERINICHCQACQRRTGSVFHCGAVFAKAQVQPEGESKVYTRIAESGNTVRFHFCPECGSSVYWEPSRYPDHRIVAVGTFADPTFPAPFMSVWEETMHAWVRLPAEVRHFPQGLTVSGFRTGDVSR